MGENSTAIEYEYLNLPLLVSENPVSNSESVTRSNLSYPLTALVIASLFLILNGLVYLGTTNASFTNTATDQNKQVLGAATGTDSTAPNYQDYLLKKLNTVEQELTSTKEYLATVNGKDSTTNSSTVRAELITSLLAKQENLIELKNQLQSISNKLNTGISLSATERLLILSNYNI